MYLDSLPPCLDFAKNCTPENTWYTSFQERKFKMLQNVPLYRRFVYKDADQLCRS